MSTVDHARIYLRPWCEDDVDELLGLYADAEVMRYISGGRPFSRERVLRMLEHAPKKAGERRYRSGFGAHHLERIISVTGPENGPSRRVMEKIGLIYQGTRPYHESRAVWYALDRTTWENGRA